MRSAIPLPWWSPRVHDIAMDEVRGGWRFIGLSVQMKRKQHFGPWFGFEFHFSIGLGTRFNG